MIDLSAGILFVYQCKALLLHPTNGSQDIYMPPKGGIEKNETVLAAACRETLEETGIDMKVEDIEYDNFFIVSYYRKKELFKKAMIFIHYIKSLDEIGLIDEYVPQSQLQISENDLGIFMDAHDIELHCFWRYRVYVLDAINKQQ